MNEADVERYRSLVSQRILQRAQDADRLEERLARLEWSSYRETPDRRPWWRRFLQPQLTLTNCCPVCSRSPDVGHTGDCWFGEELRLHLPGRR